VIPASPGFAALREGRARDAARQREFDEAVFPAVARHGSLGAGWAKREELQIAWDFWTGSFRGGGGRVEVPPRARSRSLSPLALSLSRSLALSLSRSLSLSLNSVMLTRGHGALEQVDVMKREPGKAGWVLPQEWKEYWSRSKQR